MPSDSLSFERAASFYDETRGFAPEDVAPVAALLREVAGLTPASRVYEVGIGTGRIALPLSQHARAIFGIDLARAMLARLVAKRSGEPVYVAEGDATRLPYPAGVFDAAVAVHVFHVIADWQKALAEVARVLRPGGLLVHAYNDRGEPHPTDQLMIATWEATVGADQPPTVGADFRGGGDYLAEAGWQPVGEARAVPLTPEVHSPAGYLGMLEGRRWSSLWRVSDEALARGVAAVRETLAREQIDPAQTYPVPRAFVARAYAPPE